MPIFPNDEFAHGNNQSQALIFFSLSMQFAGGFDPESMQAFESLRACANRPSNPPDQHIEEEGEQQEEPEEQ